MARLPSAIGEDDPRRRLADATRHIIDQLASSTAGPEAFAAARDLVEQAAELLMGDDHGRSYVGPAEASLLEFQVNMFADYSPLVGPLNPLAPPIEVQIHDDRIEGLVTYRGAYEGPPGCVHGGVIAAGFDDLLGFAQALSGAPGMTGRLTVRYRSPTPLHEPLRYVARLDRVEGRKIFAHGELLVVADGRLCAEAEGLFISVPREVFQRMIAERPAD